MSPLVKYSKVVIESSIDCHITECQRSDRCLAVTPVVMTYEMKTIRKVPKDKIDSCSLGL